MKVELGVLFMIVSLVAVAQAKYELSCAKSELNIRWPSYESNSEYYVCSRLFGRQMTVTCNPGEVFTFVLQSCTNPNKYIPAPSLRALPTASPVLNKANEDGFLPPLQILDQPQIIIPQPQPEVSSLIPMPPVLEESKPVQPDENVAAAIEEIVKPLAPLPPTPAPTPPVVENETTKKHSVGGKKPAGKKKKSTVSHTTTSHTEKGSHKKSNTASGKRTPPKKNAKQNSKGDKAPKKTATKSKASDKKLPKA